MKSVEIDQWAELHPDLLNEIGKHIHSYDDYLRLREVCKSWNLALPKTPHHHHHHPWLVLPFDGETYKSLSLDDEKVKDLYYLRLPEIKNSTLRGSCYGWLIIINIDGTLRMMNPFTRANFDLPHMSTFPDVVAYHPDKHEKQYTLRDIEYDDTYTVENIFMQKIHVRRIILSSPPNCDNQDFMAVAMYGSFGRLALYRFGDNSWVDLPLKTETRCEYQDAIFYEGKIYAIDWSVQLYEFDLETRIGGISEVPPPHDIYLPCVNYSAKYLIESPEGGLLLVIRHFDFYRFPRGHCYKTTRFDIHKLNKDTKQWSRVTSLGNHVLAIGLNSSTWMSPHNFPDGKGNRVYYTDNIVSFHTDEVCGGHDIGFLNLDDGTINQLFSNSTLLLPPPVWLLQE